MKYNFLHWLCELCLKLLAHAAVGVCGKASVQALKPEKCRRLYCSSGETCCPERFITPDCILSSLLTHCLLLHEFLPGLTFSFLNVFPGFSPLRAGERSRLTLLLLTGNVLFGFTLHCTHFIWKEYPNKGAVSRAGLCGGDMLVSFSNLTSCVSDS